VRRLIINADDFGLTDGINRGIRECITEGVVNSTTLMASSGAFDDAVQVAHQVISAPGVASGGVGVGCHITLVDGNPLLPPAQIPSLVAGGNPAGTFRPDFASFARAAWRGQISADELQAEAVAQMRKVQDAGIRLSHFDTHKHVHLFPTVLRPLLRAARICGVRAVRNPFAPVRPLAYAHLLRRPHLWKRYTEVKLLRHWSEPFRRAAEAEDIATTDGTFGIVVTGALDIRLFRAIAGNVPEGTWELCCHPGYNDPGLAQVRTRLRSSRDAERETLTSPAARQILSDCGIERITYWDLQ